jgi:hypothetical protein
MSNSSLEGEGTRTLYFHCQHRNQLSAKWKEIVADSSGSLVVNTAPYFSRFFLDVIGEGISITLAAHVMNSNLVVSVAFDYQFGAIHSSDDPITAAYASLAFVCLNPLLLMN